jgi:hypothetical protein
MAHSATEADFQAKDDALVQICCGPYHELDCEKPPLGVSLHIPNRLPVQVDTPDGLVDLDCHCGEPIYAVEETGRRRQYCRGAINAVKLASLKPLHTRGDRYFYFHIELIYGTDGIVDKGHLHKIKQSALDEYIAAGRADIEDDGCITLIDSLGIRVCPEQGSK